MKSYILDTNVLLQDPYSIFKFEKNLVIIPAIVLDELDGKKGNLDEVGKNARTFSRLIDKIREENPGQLIKGVPLENGGTLKIESNHRSFEKLKDVFSEKSNDNRILAVAKNLQDEDETRPVIVVSLDVNVRVKADALGLVAETYESDKVVGDSDEVHKGHHEIFVSTSLISELYTTDGIAYERIQPYVTDTVYEQDFFIMKDELGSKTAGLGRLVKVNGKQTVIKMQFDADEGVFGVKPRNSKQRMLMELLMDEKVSLVCAIGQAGTGKTLIALAAALEQTENKKSYKKVLAARPVIPMGKDIGFLPGDMKEKLRPWMQPIYDNLEFLFDVDETVRKDGVNIQTIDAIVEQLKLEVEALTYIRGRSIPNQFIIIDEAQNLSKHEVKTILTRAGEGTKVVLLGDPDQIDNPYLDATNNGLVYAIEKMKEDDETGIIKMGKTERSRLAEKAARLL